jgi:hypothetical protein
MSSGNGVDSLMVEKLTLDRKQMSPLDILFKNVMKNPHVNYGMVIIEGAIGSGKSFYLSKIKNMLYDVKCLGDDCYWGRYSSLLANIPIVLISEPKKLASFLANPQKIDDWPFGTSDYGGERTLNYDHTKHHQMYIFHLFAQNLRRIIRTTSHYGKCIIIMERSAFSYLQFLPEKDIAFFETMIHGYFPFEFSLYNGVPKYIFFLTDSVDVLTKNIMKRIRLNCSQHFCYSNYKLVPYDPDEHDLERHRYINLKADAYLLAYFFELTIVEGTYILASQLLPVIEDGRLEKRLRCMLEQHKKTESKLVERLKNRLDTPPLSLVFQGKNPMELFCPCNLCATSLGPIQL